ncbi:hypothetical protein [Methylobacterium gnaphalii]|uniref:Uncharacterized protein n=1 Tax=Methylobacterium gnaphalii TaxID=1010610 RepID=A0A512JIJ4_9HYPH|nr:hypothetical protein [Methylobacterium gnaphalii]GEP09779.1 hypothetical protein MGN01_16240 [Methylobacterium gnaphalii]GLS49809.1 hypothetical protein GCM10007885_26610 [Methylobacterium gnaphalii]
MNQPARCQALTKKKARTADGAPTKIRRRCARDANESGLCGWHEKQQQNGRLIERVTEE